MPHCIIEYSATLLDATAATNLMHQVRDVVAESSLFDESTIKVRAIPFDYYLINTSASSFMAITIKILEGRVELQKQQLATAVLNAVVQCHSNCSSVSVEVIDIQAAGYVKVE